MLALSFLLKLSGIALLYPMNGHMLMKSPLSRGYKGNPGYSPVDYDLNSPLPRLAMCKGKQPGPVVQTIRAGDTVNVAFEGSAKHGGGICQFSLSYDNDQTFYVIEEILGGCPQEGYMWPVKFPENLPSCERCTFAWSWINSIGNREFYMNCADIRITSPHGPGKIFGTKMLIANMQGYQTIQPRIHPGGGPQSPGTKIRHLPISRV